MTADDWNPKYAPMYCRTCPVLMLIIVAFIVVGCSWNFGIHTTGDIHDQIEAPAPDVQEPAQ